MSQTFSTNQNQNILTKENFNNNKDTPSKKTRKYSLNSSSDSESFNTNINEEIKTLMENDDNLSFSSNSEQESKIKKENIDYLFEPRFWKTEKNSLYDNDQEKKIVIKNGIKEESNKQSTQGNEDEEIRNEQIHNNSLSESENEINSDKIFIKKDKTFNNNNNISPMANKEQKKIINNKDKNNINGTNILINGSNFTNNINFKNTNGFANFIFPYEHINYLNNQNGSNYFPGPYLSNNFGNFNTNYNLSSPLENKNIIINANANNNKLTKLLNDKNDLNNKQEPKNNNNNIKELSSNNNNQNNSLNYTAPKLNINMTYYPKLQNNEISTNKQSTDNNEKIISNPNSNFSSQLKSPSNTNNNTNKQNKKNNTKDNDTKNSNNINNTTKPDNSNKTNNAKAQINNINNSNNNTTTKNSKCEKLFLNLDDIASGKDIRTTIMIRNIPIKYTENILNDTFKEFHGKYDCLYMPFDYEKKGNKGYAFINFINPLHILLFYEKFNGKKWDHFESPKICELNMAHFQGVNEIQKHAKNYKELKKACFTKSNDKIVIPSKYLMKLKKRYPKMKYSENSNKKEFEILSFN